MTESFALATGQAIQEIRALGPVIHNITNYVVMNSTANALLALGASPVMAHAEEEMADMVDIASALVINIGTLSQPWIKSMFKAAAQAAKRGLPIVLDPVGAGATAFRTHTVLELVATTRPTIIRGNASEILALCGDQARTKGVDSREASRDAVQAAQTLHDSLGSVICISGETDYIVGDPVTYRVHNGHAMMTRVTGLGCTATALCGAFAAVTQNPAQAAAQAMAVMGIAGEMAAEKADGPGSLQMHFLDALYRLNQDDLLRRLRMEA